MSKLPMRTLIIGIIAGVATIELLWGAWILWGPKEKQVTGVSPPTVTFALSPERGTFAVGEPFDVSLEVHTNGRAVSAIDMILVYDPRILRPDMKKLADAPVQATSSALFDAYPNNTVDRNGGRIELSAIRSVGRSFTGSGTVGKIRFIPLNKGKAEVKFSFEQGNTTDSNAADAESGKDIVGYTVGGVYEIK